jgi:hypothetical protein
LVPTPVEQETSSVALSCAPPPADKKAALALSTHSTTDTTAAVQSLYVATCAGVSVPEPRAADLGSGFKAREAQSELAQAAVIVEAAEPSANDHRVVVS